MSDNDATQARQDVVADVDEILEHVINANSLSMPYEVYLDLFNAVAELGGEIENLQAENAKLREQVAEACKQLGGAWVRCSELLELARFIMHQCNDGNPQCDECIGWNDGECVALLRMRELGIEVEG